MNPIRRLAIAALRSELTEREAAARRMATTGRPSTIGDVKIPHELNRRTRVFWDGYAHGVRAVREGGGGRAVKPHALTPQLWRERATAGYCTACWRGPFRALVLHLIKAHGMTRFDIAEVADLTLREVGRRFTSAGVRAMRSRIAVTTGLPEQEHHHPLGPNHLTTAGRRGISESYRRIGRAISPEQRRANARKGAARRGRDSFSAAARAANLRRSPEFRHALALTMNAAISPEQRHAAAQKGWLKRRATMARAKDPAL